jgi:hypothetical protein
MQTLFCQRTLLLAYLLSTPAELMPNAALQALPEAEARHERRLEAVACKRLFGEEWALSTAPPPQAPAHGTS